MMNISACNMRSNLSLGMPPQNVCQKRQFHHATTPSLEHLMPNKTVQNSDKHFHNPNIFNPDTFDKSIPSSYKHSKQPGDTVQEKNSINCCVLILEETKQTASDSIQIDESPKLPLEMTCQNNNKPISEDSISKSSVVPLHMEIYKSISDDEMPSSDYDDDSFIIFETAAGPSKKPSRESPIIEFIDADESSSEDDDDDDVDWGKETLVFHNSNQNRERQSSTCESEDSFIVFDDEDHEVDSDGKEKCGDVTFMVFGDEDSDEDIEEREKKSGNGKKVTFAEGADLCTVHLMVKWSFAYNKARKGLWEQFGRDNARFKYRADLFGMKLNKFLQPQHRQKIYEERFKEGIE